MANNDTIHLAFSINNPYTQHLGVTLASLLTNYRGHEKLCIHILGTGLNDDNKAKLERLKAIHPFDIDYVILTVDDFKDCPNNASYITIETYFRLKIPSLFADLNKILYLDADIVVTGNIADIWQKPLGDNDWIAGVQDIGVDADFLETLGMKRDALYTNMGVLLMNLKALRKNDFEGRCFEYIRKNAPLLIHVDQDVINPICENHIHQLPPQCNLLHGYLENPTIQKFPVLKYTLEEIKQSVAAPIIIHYTGPTKPWFYKCKNPKAHLYAQYIRLTPWKDFRYPDKTLPAMIKKRLSRLKRAIKKHL